LHLAQPEAKEYSDEKESSVVDCCFYGESETAVEHDDGKIVCCFCKGIDSMVECSRCTESYRISEMVYWGENDYGFDLYFCPHCNELLNSDD
jgi:hypothetical protein